MDIGSMSEVLRSFGIRSKEEYFAQAFSRNIGLFTDQEQKMLAQAKVAIPGMGGVGGGHLITMVRTGIGRFAIADFDRFEPVNVNRQFGARVPEFGRPKLEVMKKQALSINPFLEMDLFPEGINETNLDRFLDGVDVVLDGLDFFEFEVRRMLFKKAAEKGIFVITAGPMGYSSAMLVFDPGGMGFDEYFNITKGMQDKEKYLSFALGLAPRPTHVKYMDFKKVDLDLKAGPSLNLACQICSGMAGTEAVKIILKKGKVRTVPSYVQYDPFLQKLKRGTLVRGNKNPVQKVKLKVVNYLLERNKIKFYTPEPERPEYESQATIVPQPVIDYILRAGIQAPSGDNAQPWRFASNENQIFLYLNRDKDRSFFNVRQIASIISCGCVLENMRIAASAFGLQAEIKYLPDSSNSDLMAAVSLTQEECPKDKLADEIWKRHTNRKPYNRKFVPDSVLESLHKTIDSIPGAKLHFITKPDDLKKLAKIIYQVDQIRTEHRPLHEHLMEMIRFTDHDALAKKDGFPLKNLEAGVAGELFLKATRLWAVMNIVNKTGLGRMVAVQSYKGILDSSGVALFTVDGQEDKDFLKGGQALERTWLTLTSQGLDMQPMTAVTLFYLRWILNGKDEFQRKHQKVLEGIEKKYSSLFAGFDFKKESQVMLFRFGYGEPIKCRTLRMETPAMIVKK
ncbi:putative dinucleotide-utilizing biosynthesis family protein (molybdopterin and thiamine biosynthesis family protein) [Desulforapulum autotrophicum HRM2]|uniref:Dinucleotide-utilizing biosynthesis family protein (Molybdopterin and thiamine biosynthesis family protein) n=1 Tax=Desulforapulum autotrophicum (strain ATCC 43914 / DSM 3382 / VKM B-1955 / HRM2) TaxID=177437 RepID=C0QCP2_DESAH|nr:ThiF family adenylyltransferase [Desulforapulum autotrophicum]ACN15119.1 putative dinucleotide-utilizing biosynthesis family protein (molybdopterin and thiamine biosynthesis family protein) [Desulforapulum autotrophicum HRM2]